MALNVWFQTRGITSAMLHPNCKARDFTLDFADAYDDAPAKVIAKMLEHKDSKIERLSLGGYLPNRRIGSNAIKCFGKTVSEDFKATLNALKHENNKVHILRLRDHTTQVRMDELVSVLTHENNKLKQLFFDPTRFGANKMQLLSQGLKHPHCNVTSLHFSYCRLGLEDMMALAGLLKTKGNRIQHLIFVDLSPGTAVIHALMEALMHENNQVRELELNFGFDPAEKKILFKALSHAHNKVAKFTCRRLSTREIWAGIVVFHNLRCLLSARQVARIGKRAAVRRLPRELVGMVGEMLK